MDARMTPNTLLLLRALQSEPGRELYGFEVMRATGLPSGTVYPLLTRLEAAGWLTARAEKIDAKAEGRPARRYYRITEAGHEAVSEAQEREASVLAALGIGITVDERQPPGTVSVVSRGEDVTQVRSFALAGPEPDDAPKPKNCKHPKVHVKGYCPDCDTIVNGKGAGK